MHGAFVARGAWGSLPVQAVAGRWWHRSLQPAFDRSQGAHPSESRAAGPAGDTIIAPWLPAIPPRPPHPCASRSVPGASSTRIRRAPSRSPTRRWPGPAATPRPRAGRGWCAATTCCTSPRRPNRARSSRWRRPASHAPATAPAGSCAARSRRGRCGAKGSSARRSPRCCRCATRACRCCATSSAACCSTPSRAAIRPRATPSRPSPTCTRRCAMRRRCAATGWTSSCTAIWPTSCCSSATITRRCATWTRASSAAAPSTTRAC